MESRKETRYSDAEWYCRKNPEEDRFYEIFFQMCQKYGVRWASAEEKERQFIEEVTRVTYERERALRLGFPLSDVRPSFAS
jgi:3-methyladenine DNA glycosylase Tag